MRKQRNLIFLLTLLCCTQIAFTQSVEKRIDDRNGMPAFLKFKNEQNYRLSQVNDIFEIHLNLKQNESFVLQKDELDRIGIQHQKFQQYYKGIKVEYGTYTLHAKNGRVAMMTGEFKKIDELDINPVLTENAALQQALEYVGADSYMWQSLDNEAWLKNEQNNNAASFYPEGEIIIIENYNNRNDRKNYRKPVLAYKFDIYAEQPKSRDYIYVDANTGEIVHTNPIIKHLEATGTVTTKYSGTKTVTTDSYDGSFRLRDYSRGGGVFTYDMNEGTNYNNAVDFTDNDNNWTAAEWDNAAQDDAAFDAHYGAQATYDYFLSKFNRNSYNDAGATIRSYVHYDANYDNAFWDGQRMTYGDGSTYFTPLTSMDVAAHEIGHAICTYTANLVYSYESGALNEGFSDIWGACVERYAEPNKSTWLIGEDIALQSNALRSMSNPKSEGQPDTYQGTNWYTGSGDNGGVHYNSGVLNHWFYILSEGKTGSNDLGYAYAINGIGIDAAAEIAYRAESVYLSSNSQYSDARSYTIQAAEDLFGACSDEVIATIDAWYAVGVGGPNNCDGSNPVFYCSSQGNDFSYEWIANVTVGDFTKDSGASGYSNFTTDEIALEAGANVNVSITPGFSGSVYNEYYKIWIDYNNDGDFTDQGEEVFSAGPSIETVSGTLTVDASASEITRMRVVMRYSTSPASPCGSFDYGEVEDYTVVFIGLSDTCQDGILNGDETDIDCGGSCEDCPTCDDGILNGDETDIDCGGSCEDCQPEECSYLVISSSDFEADWGIWNDGGSDCRRSNKDAIYANSGSRCIRLRDNTSTSTTTTNNLDLSAYEELTVAFSYITRSMDNANEDFWLQISTDGGLSFTTVEEWNRGDEFENDIRLDDAVVIQGPFSATTQLRFRADASGNSDWVYLDDIVISGCMQSGNNITLPANEITQFINDDVIELKDKDQPELEDIISQVNLFPNPVHEQLNFSLTVLQDIQTELYIIDINGRIIQRNTLNMLKGTEQIQLNVSELQDGFYFIQIVSDSGSISRKFIKQ